MKEKEDTMGSLFAGTNNTRILLGGNITSIRYIRSDLPNNLTDNDIKWLKKNDFSKIIDLRSLEEIKIKPSIFANRNDFCYKHMPVTGNGDVPANKNLVVDSYLKMVDNNLFHILDEIENSHENIMYFCTAGKDRTGIVSALLLKRANANEEAIVTDYMQSYENLKAMMEKIVKTNKDIDIEVITPKGEYICGFLKEIETRFEIVGEA